MSRPTNESMKPLVFGNVLLAFRRYWLTVVVSLFALTTITAGYAMLATPVFLTEVTMIAMDEDDAASVTIPGSLTTIAAGAGVSLDSDDYLRVVSMATLQSRSFVKKFIEQNQLLPLLFADDWDSAGDKWVSEKPSLNDAYALFTDDVMSVSQDRQTGITTLGIRWHDPQLAAEWSNALVEAVNQEMRQRAIAEAERSISYLEKELGTTSVIGIQQAIHGLIETQLNRQMQANVRTEYAFRVIDPASVPDSDDPVFPRIAILLSSGALLGLMLGVAIAVVHDIASTSAGRQRTA